MFLGSFNKLFTESEDDFSLFLMTKDCAIWSYSMNVRHSYGKYNRILTEIILCYFLHKIILTIYGFTSNNISNSINVEITAESLDEYITDAFNKGVTGQDLGSTVLKSYPNTSATDLATAMATAGYQKDDTSLGLKAAFPSISPIALTDALIAAYGKEMPQNFAKDLKAQGESAVQIAQSLVENYPGQSATDIAEILTKLDYDLSTTALALKAAFPSIDPITFTNALMAAY